jgi:hypothetical protein
LRKRMRVCHCTKVHKKIKEHILFILVKYKYMFLLHMCAP